MQKSGLSDISWSQRTSCMSSIVALLFCGDVAWTCLSRKIMYRPSSAHSSGQWKISTASFLQSPCPLFFWFFFPSFNLLHVCISGEKKLWLNQILLPVVGWCLNTFLVVYLRMDLGSEWAPHVCVYASGGIVSCFDGASDSVFSFRSTQGFWMRLRPSCTWSCVRKL